MSTEAPSATDAAKEKLGEASGQAREKAQALTGQARGRAREQIDQRSTQVGEQLSSVAQAIRKSGEELRNQDKGAPAQAVERAAEQAERLSAYLTESDADRILGDVQEFARRQPWIVAASCAALGFLAARFVRASADGDQQPGDEPQARASAPRPASTPPALEA